MDRTAEAIERAEEDSDDVGSITLDLTPFREGTAKPDKGPKHGQPVVRMQGLRQERTPADYYSHLYRHKKEDGERRYVEYPAQIFARIFGFDDEHAADVVERLCAGGFLFPDPEHQERMYFPARNVVGQESTSLHGSTRPHAPHEYVYLERCKITPAQIDFLLRGLLRCAKGEVDDPIVTNVVERTNRILKTSRIRAREIVDHLIRTNQAAWLEDEVGSVRLLGLQRPSGLAPDAPPERAIQAASAKGQRARARRTVLPPPKEPKTEPTPHASILSDDERRELNARIETLEEQVAHYVGQQTILEAREVTIAELQKRLIALEGRAAGLETELAAANEREQNRRRIERLPFVALAHERCKHGRRSWISVAGTADVFSQMTETVVTHAFAEEWLSRHTDLIAMLATRDEHGNGRPFYAQRDIIRIVTMALVDPQ